MSNFARSKRRLSLIGSYAFCSNPVGKRLPSPQPESSCWLWFHGSVVPKTSGRKNLMCNLFPVSLSKKITSIGFKQWFSSLVSIGIAGLQIISCIPWIKEESEGRNLCPVRYQLPPMHGMFMFTLNVDSASGLARIIKFFAPRTSSDYKPGIGMLLWFPGVWQAHC